MEDVVEFNYDNEDNQIKRQNNCQPMQKATKVARKVEFTLCQEAERNLGVGPFIFSSNEARPHLLADIIMLDRQEEAGW